MKASELIKLLQQSPTKEVMIEVVSASEQRLYAPVEKLELESPTTDFLVLKESDDFWK